MDGPDAGRRGVTVIHSWRMGSVVGGCLIRQLAPLHLLAGLFGVLVFEVVVRRALPPRSAWVPGHVECHRAERTITTMRRVDGRGEGGREIVEFGPEVGV